MYTPPVVTVAKLPFAGINLCVGHFRVPAFRESNPPGKSERKNASFFLSIIQNKSGCKKNDRIVNKFGTFYFYSAVLLDFAGKIHDTERDNRLNSERKEQQDAL